MSRELFWRLGCFSAAAAVTLGAFGAHALKARINDPRLIKNWETATLYHFIHSIGLLCVAVAPKFSKYAGFCMIGGIAVFSGSLYTLVLTNQRWLGAITPIGGVCMIGAWLFLAGAI